VAQELANDNATKELPSAHLFVIGNEGANKLGRRRCKRRFTGLVRLYFLESSSSGLPPPDPAAYVRRAPPLFLLSKADS
jgi:hypothetical protein